MSDLNNSNKQLDVVARRRLRASSWQIQRATQTARSRRLDLEHFFKEIIIGDDIAAKVKQASVKKKSAAPISPVKPNSKAENRGKI